MGRSKRRWSLLSKRNRVLQSSSSPFVGALFFMRFSLVTLFLALALSHASHGSTLAATYHSGMVCMVGLQPIVHVYPHSLADLPALPCKESVVQGHYNDTVSDNGWSFLSLEGNSSYTDEEIAVAAGLLEGSLTARRIAQHIANIRGSSTGFPPEMTAFLEENFGWMEAQAAARGASDAYWHHVKLLLLQLRAVHEGLNSTLLRGASASTPPWSLFYSMAILGDQDDLCPAFGGCSSPGRSSLKEKGDSHCRWQPRITCIDAAHAFVFLAYLSRPSTKIQTS